MAQYEQLVEEITEIILPIVEEAGLELVEVQYRQESTGWTLRIIIYNKSGVSVDDCARVSRETSHLLDVEDLIPHKYNLEVSSPGLDRPLTTIRDFQRNIGEKVMMVVAGDDDRQIDITGVIKGIKNEEITIMSDKEETVFPLAKIVKAKLVIEF
jgi:ribosome maturation factor RimP